MPYAQTWVNDPALSPSQTHSDDPIDVTEASRNCLRPIMESTHSGVLRLKITRYLIENEPAITAELNLYIRRIKAAIMNSYEYRLNHGQERLVLGSIILSNHEFQSHWRIRACASPFMVGRIRKQVRNYSGCLRQNQEFLSLS